ncbi:putative folate receptor [Heracleum sosnowskyi]|uniref:Folate receptor n=1 Tax=Heracleum sosnowskyi TaxID=360622 RepID=A0AAD8JBV2_9APIA|nr:putative folate receptor [Heracleum sosnowskyi]
MKLYYIYIYLSLYIYIFLLLASLNSLLSYASGNTNEVCLSKGGRFPPYSNQGKPPRSVSKGPKDLILCRMYRKKTCCDVSQTHPAFMAIRKLASTGEANADCLLLWEYLECSICDPQVGVQSGPPLICASLCDRVYDACSSAYFSMDAKIQALAPCGVNDFICGRASEWISNGTELCHAAGFAVKPLHGFQDTSCYGGRGSLDAIADAWKSSKFYIPQKAGVLEDFKQWLRETTFSEKVSWAVAGLVLTAGFLFNSRKKRHSQENIQAIIQRNARIQKLDQKNPSLPADQANAHGR